MSPESKIQQAKTLARIATKQSQEKLLVDLNGIASAMNARGILISSIHVNQVAQRCKDELRTAAEIIWKELCRVVENSESTNTTDLEVIFQELLVSERKAIESAQSSAIDKYADQLQNKSMLQVQDLHTAHLELLAKYEAEILLHVSLVQKTADKDLYQRIKSKFLDNGLILVIGLTGAAIIFIGSFTDAITKIRQAIGAAIGDG